MKLMFTDMAMLQIKKRIKEEKMFQLKLTYDSDDCGCAVNGISFLQVIEQPNKNDKKLITNFVPTYIEQRHEIFFDEEMKVEFDERSYAFRLSSPQQIINPRLALHIS
ncbi:iron-sulfur cluster biosynthesis family protein [Anaerobacillus sp. MEB173]|uniref:iron-sulfur cluster biosynthesis family protein n=1 Tax=Anaerobacillus sp. MEB173 TaxID=3383345 RepID=UPI003F913A8A